MEQSGRIGRQEAAGSFGRLLRVHRQGALLSQEKLAELAQLSVRTIRDLERHRVLAPHGKSVRLLADALGLEGAQREEFQRAAGRRVPVPAEPTPSGEDPEAGVAVHDQGLPTPRVPQQLPLDVRGFTGRDAELERLDRLLTERDRRTSTTVTIVSVSGTAGVGKTALAVCWAHRVRERFPDGSLFADLRGYGPTGVPAPPEEVLDGFLRALGVPPAMIPATLEERAALWRTRLDGRQTLLVLDNAATSEQVRWLLPGSPGCVVVVTSRSRLSGLVARAGAHRIVVDLLSEAEALALLRRLIGADRVDAEPGAATELARRCARLPLALRLAAERANARPHLCLSELAGELTDECDRLDLLATDDDGTAAVRAVFSWSYRALSPDAARTFRLLGLHPGPDISLAAVAALTGTSSQRARRLTEALTGVHLLEERARDRYRFHDLLCLYARDKAHADQPPPEREAAVDRLLGWYLDTADRADRALMPDRPHVPLDRSPPTGPPPPGGQPLKFTSARAALGWCENERANLIAVAGHAAQTGRSGVAWRLAYALWGYFAIRKGYHDWLVTLRLGLAAARDCHDRLGEGLLVLGLAHLYCETGRSGDAFARSDEAVAISDEIDEPWIRAAALHLTSVTHRVLGQSDRAVACGLRAIRLFDTVGDPWTKAWALSNLGMSYVRLGMHIQALDCARHAHAYFTRINDQWGTSDTSSVLANVYRSLGQPERAARHCRQALSAAREVGNRVLEGLALFTLGELQHDTGQTTPARASWRQALAVFEEIGAPEAAKVRARLR